MDPNDLVADNCWLETLVESVTMYERRACWNTLSLAFWEKRKKKPKKVPFKLKNGFHKWVDKYKGRA
jgi:hypothetical protein